MNKVILLLALVTVTQIIPAVLFKFGSRGKSGKSRRWLVCFLLGNVVGITSMVFGVEVYGLMPDNANLAGALMGGLSFIAIQISLAAIFRSRLNILEICGVGLVAAGLFIAAFYAQEGTIVERDSVAEEAASLPEATAN